jgi:hypothetical protein
MCFVRISEQTATFTLYINKRLVFITGVESVYCAVRTESLYKTDYLSSLKGYVQNCQAVKLAVDLGAISNELPV